MRPPGIQQQITMAKRKRKKNPTLRWVAAVLAAAGAFQLGAFFTNFVGGLLAAALAFYVVWTALR